MALILASAVGWLSCTPAQPPRATARIAENPPYFFEGTKGEPQGIVADLLKEVNRRGKIHIDYGLAPNLTAEHLLASNETQLVPLMVDTPERRDEFFITDTWMEVTYSKLARAGNEQHRPPGIAHVAHTYAGKLVRREFPGAPGLPFPTGQEVVQAVCSGEAGWAFLESRRMQEYLLKRPPGCERTDFEMVLSAKQVS